MSKLPSRVFTRRRLVQSGVAVAAVVPFLPKSLAAQQRQVVIYNWDSYIDPGSIPDFERQTGIRVRYDLFASNAELFGRLRAGNPGYDVIFPTNDWVARMIAADMLAPLDHGRLSNLGNIGAKFMDAPHDPERAFSVPYFWGTTGIGYRKSVVGQTPESWSTLFTDPTHAGRIALLNSDDTIYAALKYLGYSLNTTNQSELDEAVELLIAAKPRIRTFAPDNGEDLLLAGEVDLCLEYNGDILQVMEEDDDLSYVVPQEGGLLWEDDMCIARGAPNVEEAHEFIDYILDAENAARIAEYILYPTPNEAALALLPEEILNNPAIYPSEATMAKLEYARYQGEDVAKMYDDALTRVLAA
ncbi:MAG: spermidine/putrescine ABC transporter substrate-binding protein [Geminicoccaceae bacterium]|nr:MAG: spermidine/putrescine ABC transporter substrate-binding protein [Geminicoccaceae bacterium]